MGLSPASKAVEHLLSPRVQSTHMVQCRVSILGITIMIWGSMPQNSTKHPFGSDLQHDLANANYPKSATLAV